VPVVSAFQNPGLSEDGKVILPARRMLLVVHAGSVDPDPEVSADMEQVGSWASKVMVSFLRWLIVLS
jgi:hypothetical protein